MCKCESDPTSVLAYLEREQDGDSRGYGKEQNWQLHDERERLWSPLKHDYDGLDRWREQCQYEEVAVWNDDLQALCMRQNCKCLIGCSFRRAAIKARNAVDLRVLQQEQDDVRLQIHDVWRIPHPSSYTHWWEGNSPDGWRVPYPSSYTQKTMHLADRLLRVYPGILKCDSARAMALYRRVSADDLIAAQCDRNAERMLE